MHLIWRLFQIFFIPCVVWLRLEFLLAFLNVPEAGELSLVHVLSYVEAKVAVEEVEVNVDRIGSAAAEVSFTTNFEPVVDGEVYSFGNIESKVEALVVGRGA